MHRELLSERGKIAGMKLVFLVILSLCVFPLDMLAAAEIKVGGEAVACKGMFEVIKEQVQDETGISLSVKPTSSEQALLDLDMGDIDIATTDVPLGTLTTNLQERGYLVMAENFQAQGIGTNIILVYLNKENSVTALSQKQLHDIFTGNITNWNQVGGDNRKIVVVWGAETPEMNQLFSRYIIGNDPLVKKTVKASDQHDIIEKIIRTQGAIGIASHVYQSARTRNPKTPFVSAKVIAITKGAPSEEEQKLLELVKSYDFY